MLAKSFNLGGLIALRAQDFLMANCGKRVIASSTYSSWMLADNLQAGLKFRTV